MFTPIPIRESRTMEGLSFRKDLEAEKDYLQFLLSLKESGHLRAFEHQKRLYLNDNWISIGFKNYIRDLKME